MATQPRSHRRDPLPEALSSSLGKLVYLYLRERGDATVVDLRDALGVPQLRLYPAISALERRGLVERDGDAVWLSAGADPTGTQR